MIKLVVADFDGTLLPYGQLRLSDAVINSIDSLVSQGVCFSVASGRTYSELYALFGNLSDKIYFICDDGALTVYKDKVIFKKPFSRSGLSCFFDDEIFKGAVLYSIEKAYIIGNVEKPVLYGKTPIKVKRLIEINDDVYKVCATLKKYDVVNSKDFRIHYSEGLDAEFVTPYANKGVAVGDLQLKVGVSKYETAAIGDAANDISMMSHAVYSYSIGDRCEALKKICFQNASSSEEVLGDILNQKNDIKRV